MKQRILLVMATLLLCLAAANVQAADPADVLRKAVTVLKEQYGNGQIAKIMRDEQKLREAGMSYQSSLVVPLKGSQACKDKTQLGVLSGMIVVDAHYAVIFEKKSEYRNSWLYLKSEVTDRMKGLDDINFSVPSRNLEKILAEGGTPQEVQQKYENERQKQFDQVIEKIANNPEAMALMIDSRYGITLESLYLVSNLALNEVWGDKVMELFTIELEKLGKVDAVMRAFKDTPYAKLMHQPERTKVLQPIRELLMKKKGKLDKKDITMIIEKVKAARAPFLKPCP